MARHLVLNLCSPLVAFGGEVIDNRGVIREFPALSMLTGLIANALGWDRSEDLRHNRLQQRLRMGAVVEPGSRRLQDFQTVELGAADKGWTTWGVPEERRGGASTYAAPHLRYRDYHADLSAWVVLHLRTAEEAPTLDDVAHALDRPVRPLFVGRKPCLPTARLVSGWQESDDVFDALQAVVRARSAGNGGGWRAQWPDGEGGSAIGHRADVCDERDWCSGLHGGWRSVREALLNGAEASE